MQTTLWWLTFGFVCKERMQCYIQFLLTFAFIAHFCVLIFSRWSVKWIRVIDQISASRHVNLWTWKDPVTDAIVKILFSSISKESSCNAGAPGLITGWRRSLGEGNGNPLQYPCLENPMDRGAYRLQSIGSQESDMT